nr:protein kinase [Okeania sp. SIO2C9]
MAVSILEILVDLQKYSPPIIHRDIKPENILINKNLNVYLIDFGLARIRPMGKQALSSIAAGTPGFMPPEEMFNLPLTEASDLYSLGATLICLLTGTKSGEISNLIGEDYRFKFKHLIPKKVNQSFVYWLEKLVESNVKRRYPNASIALKKLKPIVPTKTNNFIGIDKVKPLALTTLLMIVAGINIKVFQDFSRQQKTAASFPKANKQESKQSVSNPLSQAVKLEKQGDKLFNSGKYDKALLA